MEMNCRDNLWDCTVFAGVLRQIMQSELGCQALSCLSRTSAGERQTLPCLCLLLVREESRDLAVSKGMSENYKYTMA